MFGRISWTRQSDGKTLKKLWSLVSKSLSENIEDSLNLSGFNNLRTIFGRDIIHRYFYDIMYSKIHHNENKADFFLKYEFITQLNQQFKCDYGSTLLSKYLIEYLDYIELQYHLSTRRYTKCIHEVQDKAPLLCSTDKLILETKINKNTKILCSTEIDAYINGKSSYDKEDIDKIISLLSQLISVTNIDIIDDKMIEGLVRIIHIDDINKLAIFLKSKHLNNDKINIMYFIIIANHINNSVTSNILHKCIKNYILKYYFVTNNELYNKLYAIIDDKQSYPSPLTYTKVIAWGCELFDKYKKIIDDFNVFINPVSIFND